MNKHLIIIALLALCALPGCGGGGDEEEPKLLPDRHEEPLCKRIPAEERQAECGT